MFVYSLSEKKSFFPLFEVVHYHLDMWYMFKYRPYSHVHAWLPSTAHPQRKLPIIFCITPHTSPTYSPLTFSRTLFHLMETITLLLSTVWIIVIDKLIEREIFQWTTQKNSVLTDSKELFYFQHVFMSHHMAFLHMLLKRENDTHQIANFQRIF